MRVKTADGLSPLDQDQLQDESLIKGQSSLGIARTLQINRLMDLAQCLRIRDQFLALEDLRWQQVVDLGDLIKQDLNRLLYLP